MLSWSEYLCALQKSMGCLWTQDQMARLGPQAFGYDSFDALWMDYTVFSSVRNPYDRAGSAYEYILQHRVPKVRVASTLSN